MSPLVYILIIVVCIALSGFFSSSETALLRLTEDQIDRDMKKRANPGILAAKDLIKSSSRLLVTILLGNNVVNILAASCASSLAVAYLGDELGLVVSTVLMTIIVLIFAEILPKAIAAKDPRMVSYKVALPLYLIHKLATPFHILFDKAIDPLINKIAGGAEEESLHTETILRMARQISVHKSDGTPFPIIWSAAQAANLTAEHIMTPSSSVFACSSTESPKAILDKIVEKRFTRVPIYEGTLDTVLGTVHLKDLIRLVKNNDGEIGSVIKDVIRVPKRKPILHLLSELQSQQLHMAIVKDEHGATQGLLTLEDILEELVGEIRDEFDMAELNAIKKLDDGTFEVFGSVLVHDFNKEAGWAVKSSLGDTFAGLVFNSLGRPATLKDSLDVEPYKIKVIKISKGRIAVVNVSRSTLIPEKNEPLH